MKIGKIEIYKIDMPLKDPYTVSYGSFHTAENIFIRIDSGVLSGWGCAAPDPHVTGETPGEVFSKACDTLPELPKKMDPYRKEYIISIIKKEIPGMYSLWSAVDTALWDLLGKKSQLPVWKILGGFRQRIKTSVTIGICGTDETLRTARELLTLGFTILKVKGGLNAGEDIERLTALRRAIGPGIRLRFDANQGYTVQEALAFAAGVHDLKVELFEQPTRMEKPEHLGLITGKTEIPIMADESLLSLFDAFHLVRKGLIDLMNIKLMKVGGISEATQVDALARAAGVEVMVGCMDEAALGIAAGLHFALSRSNIRYADLDGHMGLQGDPSAGSVILKKGYLYPSSGPGFGWNGKL